MLDTNIVSELIRSPGGLAAKRARAVGGAVCLSVIVAAELRYGCAKKNSAQLKQRVEAFLSAVPVLAFDVAADQCYGEIRAELEIVGLQIGRNDLLIAAHAVALGATIVTANVAEFQRVAGLSVENWLG
jgi:tRNA(fMet)-specific endonuclease VapC